MKEEAGMALLRGRGRRASSEESSGSPDDGRVGAGRRRRRARGALALLVLVVGGLTLAGGAFGDNNVVQNLLAGIPNGQGGFGQSEFNDPGLGDLPIDPEWLTNTVSRA